MKKLQNKHIVLGITGGIAAYKAAETLRRLQDAGASVRVVMTCGATRFITPLTFQALSGHDVLTAEADNAMDHIQLARWADLVLVAPATADFISRLVHGRADELLSALCLATEAPIAVAPAMNQQMWQNPATQSNIALLVERGIRRFGPAEGSQACGETGPGRMLEPNQLVVYASALFETGSLQGLRVLITAGPTREAIDPVRVITNLSSGKMGYAIAEAARDAGAEVILISGPTCLPPPERCSVVNITSADEMHQATMRRIGDMDIFIGVAAVSDYRMETPATSKLKKDAERIQLTLVKNPDILANVATHAARPYCVGFAAETENLEQHGRAKLENKGVDLIVANEVGGEETGIGADHNRVLLIDAGGTVELARARKSLIAHQLIQVIAEKFREKNPA